MVDALNNKTHIRVKSIFFFFSGCTAWSILVPWPGIDRTQPWHHCRVLTTGPPGNYLEKHLLKGSHLCFQWSFGDDRVCVWAGAKIFLLKTILSESLLSLPLPPQWVCCCCCCSVAKLCPTLCDPMDCSTPGFPVIHHFLEFAQTHVRWVNDAIQSSHPLSSPSPLAFNLSQHQGLFQWVGSSHQVAKILGLQIQHQSFQWIFRVDFL